MEHKILLEDVLSSLGFTNKEHRWEYDFGNFKINASHYFGLFEFFHFSGFYVGKRIWQEFDFKLPVELDSYEQGVAFISYYLRGAKLDFMPRWVKAGLEWENELPWKKELALIQKREEEKREYAVQLDYDWFKVLIKKLKQFSEQGTEGENVQFSFDGNLLSVQFAEEKEVIKGSGKPWNDVAVILNVDLSKLPKRILRHYAEIILYKDRLYLCHRVFVNVRYEEEKEKEKE